MAKFEQFVVVKVSEEGEAQAIYENKTHNVKGTLTEVRRYAEENNYGGGVVEFVKLKYGYEHKRI